MDKAIILGVIQVRMGSTRLPGKALKDICGKPLLGHLYERAQSASLLQKIVIATADTKANLPIIEFAKQNGIEYLAGSENDLVDRFYQTALRFNAGLLVRMTGDCPLIDPCVIDKIVAFFQDNIDRYDYVSNTIRPTYPDGLDIDILPFTTIERMWRGLKDPFWREWLTGYIIEHPQEFRTSNVEHEIDLSHLRWTVDYEEDLIFMKEVFSRLYPKKNIFLMKDILALLEKEPWIAEINRKYSRNSAYYEAKKEARK